MSLNVESSSEPRILNASSRPIAVWLATCTRFPFSMRTLPESTNTFPDTYASVQFFKTMTSPIYQSVGAGADAYDAVTGQWGLAVLGCGVVGCDALTVADILAALDDADE
jgi:hypothetical protein